MRLSSQFAVMPEWMMTRSAASYSSSGSASSMRRASVVLPGADVADEHREPLHAGDGVGEPEERLRVLGGRSRSG